MKIREWNRNTQIRKKKPRNQSLDSENLEGRREKIQLRISIPLTYFHK